MIRWALLVALFRLRLRRVVWAVWTDAAGDVQMRWMSRPWCPRGVRVAATAAFVRAVRRACPGFRPAWAYCESEAET